MDTMPERLREFRGEDWGGVEITPTAAIEELWERCNAIRRYGREKRAWLHAHGINVVEAFVEQSQLERQTREAIHVMAHSGVAR